MDLDYIASAVSTPLLVVSDRNLRDSRVVYHYICCVITVKTK